METITSYLSKLNEICNRIDDEQVSELIEILHKAYREEKHIFVFGNGGSGATASHFCQDLGKGTLKDTNSGKRFRAISLTDNVPCILAWANDKGYVTIFEQQLRNLGRKGDVAIGISGSGNSKNVLNAIRYARASGMITVGITGFNGGELAKLVNHNVHVPCNDMGIVESIHLAIAHFIVSYLKDKINEKIAVSPKVVYLASVGNTPDKRALKQTALFLNIKQCIPHPTLYSE